MLDNENLRKIFYYSLKRTGGYNSAEELSQDIALELVSMLSKGYKPNNFNAWMWTVARCRYAIWAKNNRLARENIITTDITDTYNENLQSDITVEDDFLAEEQINLLRRELTLLSKEYREITVAYYIHNMKIADISKSTGLPEGTVKRKLYEIRKCLKEGMEMIRTYGIRSYNPDNIRFKIDRYNTTDNVPNSLVESKLAKNILLEAYANPCTTEELSISLGVATPYLEEAIDKLLEGQLLRKLPDNKYGTDFVIIDKETQEDIYNKAEQIVKDICPKMMFLSICNAALPFLIDTKDLSKIREFLDEASNKFVVDFVKDTGTAAKMSDKQRELVDLEWKNGLLKWQKETGNKSMLGGISIDESLWFFLFQTIREMIAAFAFEYNHDSPDKNYKGYWSIIGYEDWNNDLCKYIVGLDIDPWDSHNGGVVLKFYFDDINLSKIKLQLNECDFIIDVIKNDKKYSNLSDAEAKTADAMKQKSLLMIVDDVIKPTFPVIFTSGLEKLKYLPQTMDMPEELRAKRDLSNDKVKEYMAYCTEAINSLYEYNYKRVIKGLPEWLYDSAHFAAFNLLSILRDLMYKHAFENGYLRIPDNKEKSLGIGLYVTR